MKLAVLADKPDPAIASMIAEADILVTLGDLCPADIPDTELIHLYVYGNHDSPNNPIPPRRGRHNLHLNGIEVGGVQFGGFEGSMKYKPRRP